MFAEVLAWGSQNDDWRCPVFWPWKLEIPEKTELGFHMGIA